jgi:hypothetical protein
LYPGVSNETSIISGFARAGYASTNGMSTEKGIKDSIYRAFSESKLDQN